MFIEDYPNIRSPKILDILRTFTQFEARQLEQAIMSSIDSNLNDSDVIFRGQ